MHNRGPNEGLNKYQRNRLIIKENELKLQQELIRRYYTSYYLRQDLIKQGFTDIKKVNRMMSEDFEKLRGLNTIFPSKTLSRLGYLSSSPSIKVLSRILGNLQRAVTQEHRNKIFKNINAGKELKEKLLHQLKLLQTEKDFYIKKTKEQKDQRKSIESSFFRNQRQYQRDLEAFNFDFYMRQISDKKLLDEYIKITRALIRKRRTNTDASDELEFLMKSDLYARELAKKKAEEQVIRIQAENSKDEESDQKRGICW